jgi:hypothetical protein
MKRISLADQAQRLNIFDADGTLWFARELEQINATLFSELAPVPKGFSLIPSEPVARGIRVATYRMFETLGVAKFVGNGATDLPIVDVAGQEFPNVMHALGAGYGYDWFELESGGATGVALDSIRAEAARRVITQGLDRLLAIGGADQGKPNLNGLFTQSDVTVSQSPVQFDDPTADPDAIAAAITGPMGEIIDALNDAELGEMSGWTVVMPAAQYTAIASRRMGDGSDRTILDFVLSTSPWISRIEPWSRARGMATLGSGDRMAIYPASSEVIAHQTPVIFDSLPVQWTGFRAVVPCYGVTGGVVVRYPVAMRYVDGI